MAKAVIDTGTPASKVRAIVKRYYPYWQSYNDLNQNNRRLKFMINGYMHTDKWYAERQRKIRLDLKAERIKFDTAKFEVRTRGGYGPYMALIVTLPL